mgnify:CR=1 FL=1
MPANEASSPIALPYASCPAPRAPATFPLARPPLHPPIATMKELPHTHSCFVCGESNPAGLNLRFETDGTKVFTRFTPRPEHIGFKGVIHGGILSTVLDEIMVWACAVPTKRFAYCVELTVRFSTPARPGELLTVTSELTSNRRNKIFEAKSEIRNEQNQLLCSATGKYFAVPDSDIQPMLDDLVGGTD